MRVIPSVAHCHGLPNLHEGRLDDTGTRTVSSDFAHSFAYTGDSPDLARVECRYRGRHVLEKVELC